MVQISKYQNEIGESHVYNQKKTFLSKFFLFCKDTNCEEVSRDNQCMTASNKKTTDSAIPSTREGTEYGVYEEDVLFALVPVVAFIIFFFV